MGVPSGLHAALNRIFRVTLALDPSQQSPQTNIGDAEDLFSVFKGGENTLYATPVWTYVPRDGLSPRTVPAVAAFKKAVAAADKAEAEKH